MQLNQIREGATMGSQGLSDMQIVVQPGSKAARKYHSWQKLFVENHAILLQL